MTPESDPHRTRTRPIPLPITLAARARGIPLALLTPDHATIRSLSAEAIVASRRAALALAIQRDRARRMAAAGMAQVRL